jgi:hypothetical protein
VELALFGSSDGHFNEIERIWISSRGEPTNFRIFSDLPKTIVAERKGSKAIVVQK